MKMTATARMCVSVAEALSRMEKEATIGTFHTGRYRCEYAVWGSGPPLIFIHGLADSRHCFLLPMALLSSEFRCIAYSQPLGNGDGVRLERYRHEYLTEDLFALMDHLGLKQATLVGHSYGSTTAIRAMHSGPDRVPRGVLVGGFAHRPLVSFEWWLSWLARYWPGKLRQLPGRRKAQLRSHYPLFPESEPDKWQYYVDVSGTPPIRSVAHWALKLHQTDVRPLLPFVRQPVLVMTCDRDPLVPKATQEDVFRGLPNAVLFELANCGHFPIYSHVIPFAETLRKFLLAPECMIPSVCAPASEKLVS